MQSPSLRIISTRPAHQANAWLERIKQAGYDGVSFPTLDIVPVYEAQEINRIRAQLQNLDEYKVLIFVSQNAVQYGCDWIDEYWPQFPTGVMGLAVGAKTLQALHDRFDQWGVANAKSLPQLTNNTFRGMNSEELLAIPELNEVNEEKVLIFRGCGGRTLLMETLQSRGAKVEHCEVYHRALPEQSLNDCKKLNVSPGKDIVSIFSGESLENFTDLVNKTGVENWQSLTLVLPSERVEKLARSLGYTSISVAENATEDAMWQALQTLLSKT